jgi:hypothetical protein
MKRSTFTVPEPPSGVSKLGLIRYTRRLKSAEFSIVP